MQQTPIQRIMVALDYIAQDIHDLREALDALEEEREQERMNYMIEKMERYREQEHPAG